MHLLFVQTWQWCCFLSGGSTAEVFWRWQSCTSVVQWWCIFSVMMYYLCRWRCSGFITNLAAAEQIHFSCMLSSSSIYTNEELIAYNIAHTRTHFKSSSILHSRSVCISIYPVSTFLLTVVASLHAWCPDWYFTFSTCKRVVIGNRLTEMLRKFRRFVSLWDPKLFLPRDGYATVCRLSVRPSCLSIHLASDIQVPWSRAGSTSKIISWLISLRRSGAVVTPAKLGWNRGEIVSAKTCSISWNGAKYDQGNYDGLHIWSRIRAFDWHQNQWPWMTLDGRNTLVWKTSFYGAHQKIWMKIDTCYQRQNIGQWF